MGIFFAVFGMIMYLIETGLQLRMCVRLWEHSPVMGGLAVAYVLGSLILVNVVSAVMVLRTMDFSGKTCGRCLCVLLHSCQLGLIWRCLKLLILYDESDWKEYLALRLIHTALQSLPFVVTMGYYMFSFDVFDAESVCALLVFILSSAIALATFNLGKYLFDSDEFLEWKVRARKPVGISLLVFGTFLMLISRCGSFILMTTVLQYWIAVPVGGHFLVYFLITAMYSCCSNGCSLQRQIKIILLSYLHIFDLVDVEETKISCRNVFYYSAVVVENVTMTAIWMVMFVGDDRFKLGIVSLIIVTFIFGVILKSSSCGCIHWVDSDDPISVDTMDLALYITKQAGAWQQSSTHNHSDSTSHGHRYHDKTQNQDSNYLEHGYDNAAFNHISTPNLDGALGKPRKTNPTDLSDNASPMLPDRTTRTFSPTGSNGDIASSNSRNTNTLNVSSQSNKQSARSKPPDGTTENRYSVPDVSESDENRKSIPGAQQMYAQETVSDKVSRKRNTNLLVKQFSLRNKAPNPIDIPLFPKECNGIVGSKVFGSPKAKHVLSNSVEEYDPEETYSSDSEYISYSYYYDTDWSTMLSFDSDDAITWSQPVSFVNLHALPKTRFSAAQSVQTWLSRLEEWEPFMERPDLSNDELPDVLDKASRQVPDMRANSSQHSDTSYRNSVYSGSNKRTNIGSPNPSDTSYRNSVYDGSHRRTNTPSTIFSGQFQLQSSEKRSVMTGGYNVHVPGSPVHLQARPIPGLIPMDTGVVLWKQEDTSSPDFVQESMV